MILLFLFCAAGIAVVYARSTVTRPVAAGTAVVAQPSETMALHDAALLGAIVSIGFLAGRSIDALLYVTTAVMAFMVLRSARRAARSTPIFVAEPEQYLELPNELRRTVVSTMSKLPDGDARHLLSAVLDQAVLLFVSKDAAFDAAEEQGTHRHVAELVTAACTTATELAHLEQGTPARSTAAVGSASADLVRRLDAGQRLFASRLAEAADALRALYAAGVEHGTPASDRVAELATQLRSDAAARSAALGEMRDLLRTRTETKS
jgi:hypothetical protein